MSDSIDKACDLADFMLEANLTHRKDVPVDNTGNGFCWQCDEPVPPLHRWCDANCRDDWQKENKI